LVGRIARLVHRSSRKRLWWEDQGASRKEARSTADAGHEPREGEPVRDEAQTLKTYAHGRLVGFGSQVLDTTEGVLGLCPHDLYGKCEAGSFGSQVNLRLVDRRKLAYEADSGSVGTEADGTCLRVTTRASDGRRGSVKAPRGPRRARGEFASSALKRRRSSGAPESDRPKLTAANSSVDPPPS